MLPFIRKNVKSAAVKDVTIHINEGTFTGLLIFLEPGNQRLYGSSISYKVPSAGTITVDGDVIYQDRVTLECCALRQNAGHWYDFPTLQSNGPNDRS